MKKSTIFGAALAALLVAPGVQADDRVNAFYDFTAWSDDGVLALFEKAANEGRMFPTKEEFENAGFGLEVEFSRGHVLQSALLPEKKIVESAPSDRQLWFNVPTGQGKETAGYPSGAFHSDVFTGWNYVAVQGGWNHSWFLYPGSWSSAAHKNGAQAIGGIEFFDSTYGDSSERVRWENHMKKFGTKNADGTFKYLDAMVNAILYFGIDGLQYNMEAGTCFSGFNSTQTAFREFWRAVRKKLAEYGVTAFIGAYGPSSSISAGDAQYYVGDKDNGQIFDIFLNYSGGGFNYSSANNNYNYAYEALGHGHGIYQGVWISTLDSRGWVDMVNRQIDIVCWGEHSVSRLFEYIRAKSEMELQDRYQIVTERFVSGGKQHPLDRPTFSDTGNAFGVSSEKQNVAQLATWGGLASMMPERAVISQDLPFNTFFALGNGEFYFYKGKKTNGSWYNMGQQDYVPTYRWLTTPVNDMATASRSLTVKFNHRDAYIGGNALELLNNTTSTISNDVILYRADLKVDGAVNATLAVKNGKAGNTDSHLKLILRKKGETNWIEVPYGQLSGATWESKTLAVSGLAAGDVIEYVGFRMEDMAAGESIYVGQLLLDDNRTIACAPVDATSLKTDLKEEYSNELTVRMAWEVNDAGFDCPAKARGMVFNSDVKVDHFEVFYKFGQNGAAREVGRTSTWHAMIPAIDLTQSDEDLYVGVRSVSIDLKSASPVVWQKIDRNPDATEKFADVYPYSYIDQGSDKWETGCETRWYERVKTTGATENLNYTQTVQKTFPTDPMPGYVKAEDVLKVAPGETVTFHIKGWNGNDGIKYCIIKVYMDFDCNHDFAGEDELLFTIGQKDHGAAYPDGAGNRETFVTDGFDIPFTIPADVVPGTSRLRLVASDAWKSHPGAAGGTAKGHTLDLNVEILDKGQTTRPVADTYYGSQDQGEAEDPTVGVEDITLDNSTANMSVYPAVTSDVINFTDVDKAWLYNVNGQMVKFISNAENSVSVADLASGVYVVKMMNGNVTRSTKIVKK